MKLRALDEQRKVLAQKEADLAKAQKGAGSLGIPKWWTGVKDRQERMFVNIADQKPIMSALQGCLETQRSDWLGVGADMADNFKVGSYDHLTLCNAWRVENGPLYDARAAPPPFSSLFALNSDTASTGTPCTR